MVAHSHLPRVSPALELSASPDSALRPWRQHPQLPGQPRCRGPAHHQKWTACPQTTRSCPEATEGNDPAEKWPCSSGIPARPAAHHPNPSGFTPVPGCSWEAPPSTCPQQVPDSGPSPNTLQRPLTIFRAH